MLKRWEGRRSSGALNAADPLVRRSLASRAADHGVVRRAATCEDAAMLEKDPGPPWTVTRGVPTWPSCRENVEVRFARNGIELVKLGLPELFRWETVRDLTIRVPYSSQFAWQAQDAFNLVSPIYGMHSPWNVELSFTSGYRTIETNLGRPTRYPWQLQFLLEDLLHLLDRKRDYSPLARPAVLEGLRTEVQPKVRQQARLLMYVDLLGLDRHLGGHGAYDRDLRDLLVVR